MNPEDYPPFLVSVSDLALDLKNQRLHDPENESSAIAELCQQYKVRPLAKDVQAHGLNPLLNIGLLSRDGNGRAPFIVLEGNRRLCALKLLANRSLVPKRFEKMFVGLPEREIRQVWAVLFKSREEAAPWLKLIHGGEQDGVGMVPWAPERKVTAGFTKRYKQALALYGHLAAVGLLDDTDFERKTTVLDRPIRNAEFLAVTGLRFEKQSGQMLGRFPSSTQWRVLELLADQVKRGTAGGLHTRINKPDIGPWAARFQAELEAAGLAQTLGEPTALPTTPGIGTQAGKAEQSTQTSERPASGQQSPVGQASPGTDTPTTPKVSEQSQNEKPAASKPSKPKDLPLSCLAHSSELEALLDRLGNIKVRRLYFELCSVPATHSAVLTVGVWAFLEVLSGLTGRQDNECFYKCYNRKKQVLLPTLSEDDRKHIGEAIQRFSKNGNATKHSQFTGAFDPVQLGTDWQAIQPALVAFASAAA